MLRTVVYVGLVVLMSWMVLGQSTENPPAFELADVHVSAPATFPAMILGGLHDGRYELRNATMLDLIKTAYGMEDEKVFGGPNWLETDRFDVIGKVPAGTTVDSVKPMLQKLLADRFKLTVHNDSKPLPAYVLSAGKTPPKMKEASGSGPTGCQAQPPAGPPPAPGVLPPYLVVSCHNMTLAAFAANIVRMGLDHPVVDSTNVEGAWDFDFKLRPPGFPNAGADGMSIFDAIDKQLGMKLELQRAPAPVIVVDKVDRKPTVNPPGVEQALPLVRPEFEAVDVKLSAPGDERNYIRPSPGGRWDASGPLRNTIGFAYDIPGNLRADLMVVPKWVETYHIDVVAKAPNSGPSAGGGRGGPAGAITDDITLRQMVHSLLVDRFKLAVHFEDRQATVYAIVVSKGEAKLKKADESERASCKPDPSAVPTAGNPGPMIAIRCQNTTLAELAHNLPNWAGGYIDHPVVDTTALPGGFDFVLMWTPRGALDAAPARPSDAPGGVASALDPGGLSLFEAIDKQLGLKLNVQKHNISVLVVDNVEPLHD